MGVKYVQKQLLGRTLPLVTGSWRTMVLRFEGELLHSILLYRDCSDFVFAKQRMRKSKISFNVMTWATLMGKGTTSKIHFGGPKVS